MKKDQTLNPLLAIILPRIKRVRKEHKRQTRAWAAWKGDTSPLNTTDYEELPTHDFYRDEVRPYAEPPLDTYFEQTEDKT